MDNSTFDETALLDGEYTGDLNTRLTPVPEGEYMAHVMSNGIKVKQITIKNTGEKRHIADFIFIVDDDDVKRQIQMQEPQVRMSVFLDLNAAGALMTKEENANANIKLGRLKDALGLKPGRKWSLRHMEGLSCYIKVTHRTDPDDIEIRYAEVAQVSKTPFDRRVAA